jgi:hypothetical protein
VSGSLFLFIHLHSRKEKQGLILRLGEYERGVLFPVSHVIVTSVAMGHSPQRTEKSCHGPLSSKNR